MDDRLVILLGQLDASWRMLATRLDGLTDGEYFWEPAGGCWSLRRSGAARSGRPMGSGDWLLDFDLPAPEPPPLTTIAWRMCHLAVSPLLRHDHTFGRHKATFGDIEWPATAERAIAFLTEAHERWRNDLAGLSGEELDQVGRSQFRYGFDREVRFVDLLAWTNLEFAHHAAEVGCLRDLYRARLT
jgi:DinB superfamily